MELSLIDFIRTNYISLFVLAGLIVAIYSNRRSLIPASGTLWIVMTIYLLRLVAYYLRVCASNDTAYIELRYWMAAFDHMVSPLMLLLLLWALMKRPYRKAIISLPAVGNILAILFLPRYGILFVHYDPVTYEATTGPVRLLSYAVVFFYLIVLLVQAFRYFHRLSENQSLIVVFVVIGTAITAVFQYYTENSSLLDEIIAIDFLLYFFYLNYVYQIQIQKSVYEKDLELSETKIRLMQDQISPHFIFNALYIIKALIWQDPKKASDSVENFSLYLHRNIDALKSSELIPFERELDHIQAFLAIENADDPDRIQVNYDISDRYFYLPALTVEPLVENAVRHGIGAMESGGILTISAHLEGDNYIITVADNGSGFRPSETRGHGVGIENTRTRLKLQCNGTLDIISSTQGTTAVISIPAVNTENPGGLMNANSDR